MQKKNQSNNSKESSLKAVDTELIVQSGVWLALKAGRLGNLSVGLQPSPRTTGIVSKWKIQFSLTMGRGKTKRENAKASMGNRWSAWLKIAFEFSSRSIFSIVIIEMRTLNRRVSYVNGDPLSLLLLLPCFHSTIHICLLCIRCALSTPLLSSLTCTSTAGSHNGTAAFMLYSSSKKFASFPNQLCRAAVQCKTQWNSRKHSVRVAVVVEVGLGFAVGVDFLLGI